MGPDDVAGLVDVEVTVDFDDPGASQIGVVTIDAAGFVTGQVVSVSGGLTMSG